jgi:hypothetical protein
VATRLPLFPLSTVLVPGLVMPLHIFEPRYRVLVKALMELPEGAPRHFGVIATRAGRGTDTLADLYDVGCTAQLREVTPYDDGRFDVAELVALRFAAYRDRLRVEQSGVPTDPRVLSYLVAAAAVLELPERQELVATRTTAERLQAELILLRREIGLLDAFHALPAVDLLRSATPTPN